MNLATSCYTHKAVAPDFMTFFRVTAGGLGGELWRRIGSTCAVTLESFSDNLLDELSKFFFLDRNVHHRLTSVFDYRSTAGGQLWIRNSPEIPSFELTHRRPSKPVLPDHARFREKVVSVQPPLDTADIVSLRVCHPQPIRRRSAILISAMSFSHNLQCGSR
jgi:hypothetical protein